MRNVVFYRDFMNPDPAKRKKIKGITFLIGCHCLSSCWCEHGRKCKYKLRCRHHNLKVRLNNFLYYNFKFKLPSLIYITQHAVDLSGTEKCPFKMERMYSCWDCTHHYGMDNCSSEEYRNASYEESRHPTLKLACKFFEKNEYADKWDKKTGERMYDS